MHASSLPNEEIKAEREEDIHFVWERLHFDRSHLRSEEGYRIRVLHPGTHNRNQGPDFLDARIEIDGLVFHGHVELHLKSPEWYQHGHQHDPRYNNVILHVVQNTGNDPVTREDGTSIPELSLSGRIDPEVLTNIQKLRKSSEDLPCRSQLRSAAGRLPEGMQGDLGRERILRKALRLQKRVQALTGDWEQVLWEELAAILGGPVNGSSFRELARALPWKMVRKYASAGFETPYGSGEYQAGAYGSANVAADSGGRWGKGYSGSLTNGDSLSDNSVSDRIDLLSLEALFFGVAGMLEEAPPHREPWPLRMRMEWAYLAQKHRLRPVKAPFLYHRMRPGGFPTIRLAQLAALVHTFPDLASLLDPNMWPVFRREPIQAGRYWKSHLRFGQNRRPRPRQMGRAFKDLVIVNILAPLSLLYLGFHGREEPVPPYSDSAPANATEDDDGGIFKAIATLPPEDNRILRKYSSCQVKPSNALEAQGLLELYHSYCSRGRCLQCRFGQEIVSGKAT